MVSLTTFSPHDVLVSVTAIKPAAAGPRAIVQNLRWLFHKHSISGGYEEVASRFAKATDRGKDFQPENPKETPRRECFHAGTYMVFCSTCLELSHK